MHPRALFVLGCLLLSPIAGAIADDNTNDNAGSTPVATEPAAEANADCDTTAAPARHWPANVQAEQDRLASLSTPAGSDNARLLAQRILAHRDFGASEPQPELHWRWRLERDDERKQDTPNELPWLTELGKRLKQFAQWFGTFWHLLLWLFLLALLLVLWRRRHLLRMRAVRPPADTIVAGIDIAPLLAPDALPDDVVAGSEHLWRAGHAREALSLLYRAALHRLGMQLAFTIPESATEGECLALVARHADGDTTLAFRRLVNGWLALAWQDMSPADFPVLIAAYRRVAAQEPRPEPLSADNAPAGDAA